MSQLLFTTSIGYETRGANEDPSSTGYSIARAPMAIRWDSITAICAIVRPAVCFDNESVTEKLCLLTTDNGSFHVCEDFADLTKRWDSWQCRIQPLALN